MFYIDMCKKSGYRSQCKGCINQKSKEKYRTDESFREYQREYQKTYIKKNTEMHARTMAQMVDRIAQLETMVEEDTCF